MRDPTDVEIAILSTEELTPARRSSVIDVCIAAHDDEDFQNLFSYIESGGRHFLAYRGPDLVSHAVVTTRWVQPEGHGELKTDKVGFYERLGWEVWRGPLAGRSEHGLRPTPEQRGVMVLFLPRTPSLDLEAQLSIECQPERIWQ